MFGLERIQGIHNGVTTNSSNVSASNDPKQVPNDATDILLKGAAKAAAGRELGLSEEETLAATSRAFRRLTLAHDPPNTPNTWCVGCVW